MRTSFQILVIDDEADLESLITKKFRHPIRQREWKFQFALNGLEALELLHADSDIQVALIDINMPRMGGFDLLTHIVRQYPFVCPIIVSAYGDMANIRKAMNLGAYDFLTKPINFSDLETTIHRAIRHATVKYQNFVEQCRMKDDLVQGRNLLQTVLDTIPDLIYVKDVHGQFMLANAAICQVLGKTSSDIQGKIVSDLFPEDTANRYAADDQEILQNGQALLNCEEPHPIESHKRILTSKVPFYDASGQITGLVYISRDVTELKQSQKHLEDSGRKYCELAEKFADGVAIVQNNQFVFVNSSLCTMLRYTAEKFYMLSPEKLFKEMSSDLANNISHAWQVLHVIHDEHEYWLEISPHEFLWERKPAVLYTIHNVTATKVQEQKRTQETLSLMEENLFLKGVVRTRTRFGDLLGSSQLMQQLYSLIFQVAGHDEPVLIYGESGTGKELVAKTLHQISSRSKQTFFPINCAAIPAGLFESELFGYRKGAFTGALSDRPGAFDQAFGGTLFLDEIGELPLEQQAKFLRVLESGEYKSVGGAVFKQANVRIIAATHKNLFEMVKAKKFREDLFYRLYVAEIDIPPLREHKEDIPLLIEFFLKHFANENYKRLEDIPSKVLAEFYTYSWPGNVRELQNALLRYITTEQLKFKVPLNKQSLKPPTMEGLSDCSLSGILAHTEQTYLIQTLECYDWNRTKAAKALGITDRTLRKKIRAYQIIQPYQKTPIDR
ncbi:MAG: sigma 54-interacting transcriptional regulator [Candidatus Babeliaceae bacterium]|nr:sigma 54-interacting transcriptional regulator [Candidatus Babeliaceae bacterium]